MSKSDSDDDNGDESADEGVGYKNPPKATRFKKGQSGNSAGRPKRQSSMKETVREVLQGRETVTVNGEPMSMATMEYLARQLVNEALRGDIGAIKRVLDADRAGDLLGAIQEQHRHQGVLVVPRPVESVEEWERLYGADAQDATRKP